MGFTPRCTGLHRGVNTSLRLASDRAIVGAGRPRPPAVAGTPGVAEPPRHPAFQAQAAVILLRKAHRRAH